MPGRMSIYAGGPIERLLAAAPDANRSARIGAAVERYLDIVEAVADPLTEVQMRAVIDLAPVHTDDWPVVLGAVAAAGHHDLLTRLQELSLVERAVVMETIDRARSA